MYVFDTITLSKLVFTQVTYTSHQQAFIHLYNANDMTYDQTITVHSLFLITIHQPHKTAGSQNRNLIGTGRYH